jgi:hypothetical protein
MPLPETFGNTPLTHLPGRTGLPVPAAARRLDIIWKLGGDKPMI